MNTNGRTAGLPPCVPLVFLLAGCTPLTAEFSAQPAAGDVPLDVRLRMNPPGPIPSELCTGTSAMAGPLQPSANTFTAIARDVAENGRVAEIAVTPLPITGARIDIVGDNAQTGRIRSTPAEPIVANVTREDGTSIASKVLTFTVDRSNGRSASFAGGNGGMTLQMRTGAGCLAHAS